MVKLHTNILEVDGVKQFVVIPFKEFEQLRMELEDYQDLKDLRAAKAEEGSSETITMAELKEKLGMTARSSV